MPDLGVPLVLLGAILLMTMLSLGQHRYYVGTVRRMAAAHAQPGLVLVSGRHKGRLRGAVAVLVLDAERRVVEARVMQGASVAARFRPRPTWVGHRADRPLPAPCSPRAPRAVADALTRLPGARRPVPRPAGPLLRGTPARRR